MIKNNNCLSNCNQNGFCYLIGPTGPTGPRGTTEAATGPTGPMGPTGKTGPAPNFAIGKVITGAPGTEASVIITEA